MALTSKQEKFCQEVVKGESYSDAYRNSYNAGKMKIETIQRKAHDVAQNGKVRARIDEIREPVVRDCRITLEDHLTTLDRLSVLAEENNQIPAAVKAQELRGKASGIYVERKESKIDLGITLSDDAITARLALLLGKL